jgi:hypothetical protein
VIKPSKLQLRGLRELGDLRGPAGGRRRPTLVTAAGGITKITQTTKITKNLG